MVVFSLSVWLPEVVRCSVGFAAASPVASAAYWVGYVKAPKIPLLATLCIYAVVALFGEAVSNPSPWGVSDGYYDVASSALFLATVVVAPLQAVFEWKRQSLSRAWYWYLVWSVGLYLGTGSVGVWVSRGVEYLAVRYDSVSPRDVMDWVWGNPGYTAGLVFAPISISFYRWAIPSLRLRPGIDHPVRLEDEL